MSRNRKTELSGDLFAAANIASATPRGRQEPAQSEPVRLIPSPFVDESSEWLSEAVKALGSLLASERAAEYVAILRAFTDFRKHHEIEPLHEDLAAFVCGAEAGGAADQAFTRAVQQLEAWNLVTKRIEKGRLRGYRDTRRQKFRYRLCDEAVQFVEWLAEWRTRPLEDAGADITGNLLDMQCSLLRELRRKLRAVRPAEGQKDGTRQSGETAETTGSDLAGDVLYRVDQMARYVKATEQSLYLLNNRLLSFGLESFSVEEAKPVIQELSLFLDRFGRRFSSLRDEIAGDIAELRRPVNDARWEACAEILRAEAAKFRHIASMDIPDAPALLADAASFYAPGGALVGLMQRITDSARKVWGKLNSRLRELERRNHRLEDIAVRLSELASREEDFVPHGWFRGLLETAAMRGDPQIRPAGEKSVHPLPKKAKSARTVKTVTWITPRKVGEKADVASIAQVRGRNLKEWLKSRGIYPGAEGAAQLAELRPSEFADFPNVVQLASYTRLGGGEKGRRFLNVSATPADGKVELAAGDYKMTCDNLVLERVEKDED